MIKHIILTRLDFDDDIINEISPILCSNDFEKLFEICEKIKNEKL